MRATPSALPTSRTVRIPSITKKQIVALTGIGLVMFVIGHLAGNTILFKSDPQAFNHYAEFLASLGLVLWAVRGGMIAIFLVHVLFIVLLVIENYKARKVRYAKWVSRGEYGWAVRTMTYTGVLILAFVIFHLANFTFANHHGNTIQTIYGTTEDLGLFGLVYNTFYYGYLHVSIYIVAMIVLGLHMNHAVQSAFKTFGFNHRSYTPKLIWFSRILAMVVAGGFIAIPLCIKLINPMGAV